MQTREAIQFALTVSNGAVLSAIDKIGDAATTLPTRNGGCHPLWVLGHLTVVEGSIPEVLFGQKNPSRSGINFSVRVRKPQVIPAPIHPSPRSVRSISSCASVT